MMWALARMVADTFAAFESVALNELLSAVVNPS